MWKWITLFSLLLIQPCFAQQPGNKAGAERDKISKNVWMHNVLLNLPKLLCQKDTIYRTCYQLTDEECMGMTRWFTSVCLDNVAKQLPDNLTSEQGEEWGAATGACVNDLFHKVLIAKRIEGENCPPMPSSEEISIDLLPDPTKPSNE